MFDIPVWTESQRFSPEDGLSLAQSSELIEAASVDHYLREKISSLLERILNALLDFEADRCCGAHRYEHSPFRAAKRAGFYTRRLRTRFASLLLRIPKLRAFPFRTTLLARYRRREDSILLLLGQLILSGPSASRLESLRRRFLGTRASSKTAAELNHAILAQLTGPLSPEESPEDVKVLVTKRSLDGIWIAGEGSLNILVAIGLKANGVRSIMGVARIDETDTAGKRWLLHQLSREGYCT